MPATPAEDVPDMLETLRKCALGWLFGTLALAGLGACSSGDHADGSAALIHLKVAKTPRPQAKAADPTANMDAAVATMKGPAGVNVKFQLGARPEPGQPLAVDFALIPDASIASLSAKFDVDDGLKLLNGDQIPPIDKPAPGVPIRHSVTVVPGKDGIYTMTVSLMVTAAGDDPRLHTFAVPIISGDGVPPVRRTH